jgi:uncharacterized protein (TIGR00255 family)
MKSMTGFGRISNRSIERDAKKAPKGVTGKTSSTARDGAEVELDISVRTVNGRYLEMRFHMPREYAALETEFKALVAKTISRGTVDIYINRVLSKGADGIEVKVNTELARKWLAGYRALGKNLKLASKPSLEMLIRVPEVLEVEEQAELSESEKELVSVLLEKALKACDQERAREGRALAVELETLCARLGRLGAEMETLKGEANAELERRYRDRLQKLGFSGVLDDQRIAQEIVMQLDRADVSEELTRLKEHLKAYRQLLSSQESHGKKLDFYAQELLREVNTIGSKSQIAKLTGLVVDAKTVVEKIREQVQNVE